MFHVKQYSETVEKYRLSTESVRLKHLGDSIYNMNKHRQMTLFHVKQYFETFKL